MEEKLKSMKLTGSNARIEYRGYDEIGQLVEQYNQTVDELEKSTRLLIQSERESAWRTMARQVAHEINNPLTPMKLTLQQLQRVRQQAPEQFDEYFRTTTTTLIEQIDNLSRIAATFSQFARLPETEMLTIDIAARVYSTVELFRANSEAVEVIYNGQRDGMMLKGDPEQLSRVFTNLLKNALQSIPAGRMGRIAIELKRTEQNQVEISISDNGSGIPEEARKNIFKPDFTTKTSGMGLGLSISRAIIENSGGTITFETEEDKGTTFTICLPLLP
jgi:nitrogen fixation/metabolism regulation signal transduction histidine kinase